MDGLARKWPKRPRFRCNQNSSKLALHSICTVFRVSNPVPCISPIPTHQKSYHEKPYFPQPLLRTRANPLPTFKDSASRGQNQTHNEAKRLVSSPALAQDRIPRSTVSTLALSLHPENHGARKSKTEDAPEPRTRWGQPKNLAPTKNKNGEPQCQPCPPRNGSAKQSHDGYRNPQRTD